MGFHFLIFVSNEVVTLLEKPGTSSKATLIKISIDAGDFGVDLTDSTVPSHQ